MCVWVCVQCLAQPVPLCQVGRLLMTLSKRNVEQKDLSASLHAHADILTHWFILYRRTMSQNRGWNTQNLKKNMCVDTNCTDADFEATFCVCSHRLIEEHQMFLRLFAARALLSYLYSQTEHFNITMCVAEIWRWDEQSCTNHLEHVINYSYLDLWAGVFLHPSRSSRTVNLPRSHAKDTLIAANLWN